MNDAAPSMPIPMRPLIRPDNCARCKFSAAIPNQTALQCRRNPPTAQHFPTNKPGQFMTYSGHPSVKPDDWCGNWVLKLEGMN